MTAWAGGPGNPFPLILQALQGRHLNVAVVVVHLVFGTKGRSQLHGYLTGVLKKHASAKIVDRSNGNPLDGGDGRD